MCSISFFSLILGEGILRITFEPVDYLRPYLHTGFTPLIPFVATNLNDPKIQEGLRISLEVFLQMNEFCKKRGIKFIVALIPTKENVFSTYIERNSMLKNSKIIDELIRNERKINEIVKNSFTENNILYIDLLDSLRNAVGKGSLYPSGGNGHPNKNGYKVIAEAIGQYVRELHIFD